MNIKTSLSIVLAVLAVAGAQAKTTADIVPHPQSITQKPGAFNIKGAEFVTDSRLDSGSREAVAAFAERLSIVSGGNSKMCTAIPGSSKYVSFLYNASLAEEEYRIEVTPAYATVEVSSRAGVLYAIQTMKQMLPVAIYAAVPARGERWTLPCVTIADKPRFAYRGLHLDCARHFFLLSEVRRFLDVMAFYKLNRFHWHLTDDQGWRIQIDKYPRLTEVGAWRSGTQIGYDRSSSDGIRHGGFYTKDEIRGIIHYADSLGITIIPEVDLPGHMLSALASYPELGCEGSEPYAVWTRWGVCKQVLNVGKEETMKFLEDVLGEVADLFPGEYFHIGGDECPKKEWEKDPACQAKIKELGLVTDKDATAETRLQNYVTARMQEFLAGKGKKIIGWDEILEGELQPGATVMSWRGTKGGIKASKAGFDVIMTPSTYCYFDYRQLDNREAQPPAIGKTMLGFAKVFYYNPTEGLDPEASAHIKGVQANLWTEYIAKTDHLEFMLFPRLFAISEVQWCQPEAKDMKRICTSIDKHQNRILDLLGYSYCKTRE